LPLSGRLVGLFVAIPPGSLLETNQVRPDLPSFYEVTVGLSIFLAIFGAYLLWRDVRRENSVAQLRTEFVSGVTHELKTPLTSIRMFAETLQIAEESGVDTAEKRAEYVETIIRESERLTRLLNNVLAFAQIERGERAYYMQSVDLRNVVEEAESMIRLSLEENGMQLEVSIVGDVPVIAADDDAMLQAVLNLLSNAIKYSGKSRRIGLSLYREGSNAVIAVTDHGVGIPGAEQKLIFESFYRVRGGDESQAVSGTGLGLAIVSDIALAHGGSVSVESNVGDGSTFFIRIPVDRDLGP
jgi:signal transduction histidine kinase